MIVDISDLVIDPARAKYKGECQTGKIFGFNKVLGWVEAVEYGKTRRTVYNLWAIECINCGTIRKVNSVHIVYNKTKGCEGCKGERQSGINSQHWKGGQYVPAYFASKAKAKLERGTKTIKWTLTFDELDQLWLDQEGKCAYTGRELSFGRNGVSCTASLDRTDSDGDYEISNVKFVHGDINIMKWSFPEDRFLQLCREVVKYDTER